MNRIATTLAAWAFTVASGLASNPIFDTASELRGAETTYFSSQFIQGAIMSAQGRVPFEAWSIFKGADEMYLIASEQPSEMSAIERAVDNYIKQHKSDLLLKKKDEDEMTKIVRVNLSEHDFEHIILRRDDDEVNVVIIHGTDKE